MTEHVHCWHYEKGTFLRDGHLMRAEICCHCGVLRYIVLPMITVSPESFRHGFAGENKSPIEPADYAPYEPG